MDSNRQGSEKARIVAAIAPKTIARTTLRALSKEDGGVPRSAKLRLSHALTGPIFVFSLTVKTGSGVVSSLPSSLCVSPSQPPLEDYFPSILKASPSDRRPLLRFHALRRSVTNLTDVLTVVGNIHVAN